jgi:hypothetical protein
MSKMTLKKWKQIGRICGYDGTRTASVWSENADRLRKACSYEMWKKIAANVVYKYASEKRDSPDDIARNISNNYDMDNIEQDELKSIYEEIKKSIVSAGWDEDIAAKAAKKATTCMFCQEDMGFYRGECVNCGGT